MREALAFAAVFLIGFGTLALTGGRNGLVASYREMLIESPRMLKVEPLQRRERVTTLVIYGTYAGAAALAAGVTVTAWVAITA